MVGGEESCPQEELLVAVEVEGGSDQMQHIYTILIVSYFFFLLFSEFSRSYLPST